ncbi:hypothetical protein, partial [uncultured Desulfovibrio sp.]|uniref:hypothetical protein n=1 Tax=uncultured Desulfovibrio sp. TaxID=167968 RepID=UPI00272B6F4D
PCRRNSRKQTTDLCLQKWTSENPLIHSISRLNLFAAISLGALVRLRGQQGIYPISSDNCLNSAALF